MIRRVGGAPAKYMRPGQLAMSGAMGKRGKDLEPSPEKSYVNQAPFGSMGPKERLARMDQEGLEKALIYPSLGLSWEAEDIPDLGLQTACARLQPLGRARSLVVEEKGLRVTSSNV